MENGWSDYTDVGIWATLALTPILTLIIQWLESAWGVTPKWTVPVAATTGAVVCLIYLFSVHLSYNHVPVAYEIAKAAASGAIAGFTAAGLKLSVYSARYDTGAGKRHTDKETAQ